MDWTLIFNIALGLAGGIVLGLLAWKVLVFGFYALLFIIVTLGIVLRDVFQMLFRRF